MKGVVLLLTALLCLAAAGRAAAEDPAEAKKIQHLIAAVETLEGAQFIRNGRGYDAGAAASHLRLKLSLAGDRVKTAEDFIRLCATGSSRSGKPYKIRFSDGTVVKAEQFFHDRLKAFTPGKP
ncbi:MAG: DUF5329 family protein [Syntrophales bacterium]